MDSLHFNEYHHLSPEEQRRRNQLYGQQMSDPTYAAFLAGLFKMSLSRTDGIADQSEFATCLDENGPLGADFLVPI